MKRTSSGITENYEQVLMCLICRNLFDEVDHQPKFLPCHHTFCKECLREYVRQMGDEIECPSCRKLATIPAAGVPALQTNFYVKYIESLVNSSRGQGSSRKTCAHHETEKAVQYCENCQVVLCKKCCTEEGVCASHKHIPLTTVTEQSHQKLDRAFAEANNTIERKKLMVEGMMKCLAEEKDSSLLKIESTFEQHVHNLTRRSTLLKNKVIDIYREHTQKLEDDLEEISTALTCIVSLKEYHEEKISQGDFSYYTTGIDEIKEVHSNTDEKITPAEVHIVFEDKHGVEKFRPGVKDLGRVKYIRPLIARSEPEGDDSESNETTSGMLTTPTESPTYSQCCAPSGNRCAPSCMTQSQILLQSSLTESTKSNTPSKQPIDLINNNKTNCDSNTGDMQQSTGNTRHQDSCATDVRPKSLPIAASKQKEKPKKIMDKNSTANTLANIASLTDDEKVKVEKKYYNTVYMSYDEEELLRELKMKPQLSDGIIENNWQDMVPGISDGDDLTSSTASTVDDQSEDCKDICE